MTHILVQSFVRATRLVIMIQTSSPQCRKEGGDGAQCSNTEQYPNSIPPHISDTTLCYTLLYTYIHTICRRGSTVRWLICLCKGISISATKHPKTEIIGKLTWLLTNISIKCTPLIMVNPSWELSDWWAYPKVSSNERVSMLVTVLTVFIILTIFTTNLIMLRLPFCTPMRQRERDCLVYVYIFSYV